MIGYLKGTLFLKNPDRIILLVNHVGYEVEIPASSLCALPQINEDVALHILTHVREDSIRLFGFVRLFDKLIFDALIQVSGVGPKAALALLSVADGLELCEMIIQNQLVRLTATPGIGAKTAERLVLELKTKLQKLLARYESETSHSERQVSTVKGPDPLRDGGLQEIGRHDKFIRSQVVDDLKSALSNLGYKEKQFSPIVDHFAKKIHAGEELSFEVALKQVLKKLSEHVLKN